MDVLLLLLLLLSLVDSSAATGLASALVLRIHYPCLLLISSLLIGPLLLVEVAGMRIHVRLVEVVVGPRRRHVRVLILVLGVGVGGLRGERESLGRRSVILILWLGIEIVGGEGLLVL